ncbi:hypothetical protein GF373_10150 [bacterium]|nr:hypothetical protein [bacterium]
MELGLAEKWSGEETTPFYKWGWKKTSGERIWGERIVKQAFQKADIWLAPEDLEYFETVCNDYANGKSLSQDKIRTKISSVVKRSQVITQWVADVIREVLNHVGKTSPEEAEVSLKESGIRVDSAKALARYGTVQLRRKLAHIGAQILGINTKGLKLEDPTSQQTFMIQGFEGWQQWVKVYKQEAVRQLTNTSFSGNEPLFKALRNSITAGLFNDFEEDIRTSLKFRNTLHFDIDKKDISLPPEKVEQLEMIFYTWQFKDGIPFNHINHKRLRDLLIRRDISAHFRELLIRKIRPQFESIKQMLASFPRHIIFLGGNAKARRFAAEQYIYHYQQMLDVLASVGNMSPDPPGLLSIPQEEIVEAQETHIDRVAELTSKVDNAAGNMYKKNYITLLIEKHKKALLGRQEKDPQEQEQLGYIIDLGLKDLNPSEFSELESKPLKQYLRFSCDGQEGTDFESNSHHAKQQRILFFNRVLDTVTGLPAFNLDDPFAAPELTAPTGT